MTTKHMSSWDQEEYALGQRTPEMTDHLTQCAACREGVGQLQQGVVLFRDAAMAWSEACMQASPAIVTKKNPMTMPAWKWAMAAVILLLALLPLSRFIFHRADLVRVSAPAAVAPLTDDALLQEVDQQVSDAVPDSMESLTHLVTTTHLVTKSEAAAASSGRGGGELVRRN